MHINTIPTIRGLLLFIVVANITIGIARTTTTTTTTTTIMLGVWLLPKGYK